MKVILQACRTELRLTQKYAIFKKIQNFYAMILKLILTKFHNDYIKIVANFWDSLLHLCIILPCSDFCKPRPTPRPIITNAVATATHI